MCPANTSQGTATHGGTSKPLGKHEKFQGKMENSTESIDGLHQSSQDRPKLGFLTGKTHSVPHNYFHWVLGQQVGSAGHESHTGQGSCSHGGAAASCLGIPGFFQQKQKEEMEEFIRRIFQIPFPPLFFFPHRSLFLQRINQ